MIQSCQLSVRKPEWKSSTAALTQSLVFSSPPPAFHWLLSSPLNWLFGLAVRLSWWDCCEVIPESRWCVSRALPSPPPFFFPSRSNAGVCHLLFGGCARGNKVFPCVLFFPPPSFNQAYKLFFLPQRRGSFISSCVS